MPDSAAVGALEERTQAQAREMSRLSGEVSEMRRDIDDMPRKVARRLRRAMRQEHARCRAEQAAACAKAMQEKAEQAVAEVEKRRPQQEPMQRLAAIVAGASAGAMGIIAWLKGWFPSLPGGGGGH